MSAGAGREKSPVRPRRGVAFAEPESPESHPVIRSRVLPSLGGRNRTTPTLPVEPPTKHNTPFVTRENIEKIQLPTTATLMPRIPLPEISVADYRPTSSVAVAHTPQQRVVATAIDIDVERVSAETAKKGKGKAGQKPAYTRKELMDIATQLNLRIPSQQLKADLVRSILEAINHRNGSAR